MSLIAEARKTHHSFVRLQCTSLNEIHNDCYKNTSSDVGITTKFKELKGHFCTYNLSVSILLLGSNAGSSLRASLPVRL